MGRLAQTLALLVALIGLCLDGCAPARSAVPHPPEVFLTAADARAILARRGTAPIAGALARMAHDAEAAAARPGAHEPYSGCELDQYLSALTYEYGGDASRAALLATYAYLHHLDGSYGSGAAASAVASQARAIVVGWATEGFRKPDGSFRTTLADFCNRGSTDPNDVAGGLGLHFGRGMPDYVQAYDLLDRTGALSDADRAAVSGFLGRMSVLIRTASDLRAQDQKLLCNRYSNHVSVQVAALAALARARGDMPGLLAVMRTDPRAGIVGWSDQVDHAIYAHPGPPLRCYPDKPGSTLAQPPVGAAGEEVDRYRGKPGQTFGYITFSLYHLAQPLMIARVAGLPAGAFAEQRSRVESALTYYSHYLAAAAPDPVTVDPALAAYPGGQAYLGKVVSSANCGTLSGGDRLLLPYAAALAAGVHARAGDALVSKVLADGRCPGFTRLDPVVFAAYAHLPGG